MEPARREKLTKLALVPLEATGDAAFLCDLEAERESVNFTFCALADFEEPEYLLDFLEVVSVPWNEARLQQISSGEAKPDEVELHQLRQAICRYWSENGHTCFWLADIVPIKDGDVDTGAFALWLDRADGHPAYPRPPDLRGVFDTIEEAKAVLKSEGYIV